MDAGSDVDVHADIQVLKLRIDQRVDADAANSRLERSGSHRNTITDLERSFLSIHRTDGGFCRILVLLSLYSAVTVALGMITRKSVAFKLPDAVQIDRTGLPAVPVPELVEVVPAAGGVGQIVLQ